MTEEIKSLIEYYTRERPTNSGMYKSRRFDPNQIPKPIRDGIFFYSTGWGWRLRKEWRGAFERLEENQEADE